MRIPLLLPLAALLVAGCFPADDTVYDFRFEVPPTAVPADPVAGQPFEIRFRARNSGDYDAQDVRWKVYRDGTEYATGLVDLDGHDSRDLAVLVPGDTAGTHVYLVSLDPDDRFDERHEDNNEASVTVVVGPSGGG